MGPVLFNRTLGHSRVLAEWLHWLGCMKEADVQAFPAVMAVSITLFDISQAIKTYPLLAFIFDTLPINMDSIPFVSIETGVFLLPWVFSCPEDHLEP